jgi:hypothetical protein
MALSCNWKNIYWKIIYLLGNLLFPLCTDFNNYKQTSSNYRRGKGAGFDIQTKFCVKFPTPGIQVLVKSIVPRGN